MKKGIMATIALTTALAFGWKNETKIKKATQINRNWKEDQSKEDKISTLGKAQLKRIRKAKLKERNLRRSRDGK